MNDQVDITGLLEGYRAELCNRQNEIHEEMKELHPQPYKKVFMRIFDRNQESKALRKKYWDIQHYLLDNRNN